MRVLWFTNTPSLYGLQKSGYHGGGWIESLEKLVSKSQDIKLAVSFFHEDNVFKVENNNTTYYPISETRTLFDKIRNCFLEQRYTKKKIEKFIDVINDYKPDLIHVFGSEREFGLLSKHTNIPVVIHIQGILNPYLNAMYAPGISNSTVVFNSSFIENVRWFRYLAKFKKDAYREELILKNCNYYLGRTSWDHGVVKLFNPAAKYFYCGEILRDIFYSATPWFLKGKKKYVVVSTISKVSYKGFDLILKTANLLKQYCKCDFEWWVFGVDKYQFWEKKLNIKCDDVNVKMKGIMSASDLVNSFLDADLFVHPSYIDNSPNSVCEAQMLGMPVVAVNVGGVSSLIDDGYSGILVPANDPYYLTSLIIQLLNDPVQRVRLGEQARKESLKRHNKETIYDDLFHSYKSILEKRIQL